MGIAKISGLRKLITFSFNKLIHHLDNFFYYNQRVT